LSSRVTINEELGEKLEVMVSTPKGAEASTSKHQTKYHLGNQNHSFSNKIQKSLKPLYIPKLEGSIQLVSIPITQEVYITPRRIFKTTMEKGIKTQLPKFKGKGDPDIFIKEFNHICFAN